MSKPKIHEVIVVEGYHDVAHLKRYYDCETIVTSGCGIDDKVMQQIKEAQTQRGVIIFTDPDTPGDRIRKKINDEIPGCKNAFVLKKDARTSRKVGVEHANFDALNEALSNLVVFHEEENTLAIEDFYDLGLLGREDSKQRREFVAKHFHIGMANGKTMLHRLNSRSIRKEELEEVFRSYE